MYIGIIMDHLLIALGIVINKFVGLNRRWISYGVIYIVISSRINDVFCLAIQKLINYINGIFYPLFLAGADLHSVSIKAN
jgi:hypothetical protein